MKIARVEFMKEYKLGAAEARGTFVAGGSSTQETTLPVPEKPGCEIHLLGDWVLVREVWKDPKHTRATIVAPRERVSHITPSEEQATAMLKDLDA